MGLSWDFYQLSAEKSVWLIGVFINSSSVETDQTRPSIAAIDEVPGFNAFEIHVRRDVLGKLVDLKNIFYNFDFIL